MTAAPHYEVKIGGYPLQRVSSLSLRFSLSELADSFQLSCADAISLEGGERVEIRVAGVLRLVGEVTGFDDSYAVGKHDFSIWGFSAAQRMVKSSVHLDRRVFRKRSLEQIVTAVCDPFGLVVDVSESAAEVAAEVLDRVKIKPAITAHAFLTEVCERQGCILVSGAASITSDTEAKANVRITRVATRMSPVPVVFPSPMISDWTRSVDISQVHSVYLVSRRGNGVRDEDGTLTGVDGVAYDERVPYSPLIIKAKGSSRGKAELDRQAEQEMRRRAGEAERVSCTALAWSPTGSPALWWPNTLYRVVNTVNGYDQVLVLASVELSEGLDGGARARLEFVPPDTYAVLKQQTKAGGGGGGGYRVNQDWLKQHADLVTRIDARNDKVVFDRPKLDLIWTPPEDEKK